MRNINILEKMNKVPGGLIIIPLLAAILMNTFAPSLLQIGGPTTALFKAGSSAMMGIFLLICGSSINIRQAGLPLYKGTMLLMLKFCAGALAVWFMGAFLVPLGSSVFLRWRLLPVSPVQTVHCTLRCAVTTVMPAMRVPSPFFVLKTAPS